MVKSQSWTDGSLKSLASGNNNNSKNDPWQRQRTPSTSELMMPKSKSDHDSLTSKANKKSSGFIKYDDIVDNSNGKNNKDSLIDFGSEEVGRARRRQAESRLTKVNIQINLVK